jgi:hypothetical protein
VTYTPRPGSTGDRVLQHIRAHGPTPVSVLAAELDKTENEIHSHLAWPMSRGGIKRKVVGDEWLYDEGDGVAVNEHTPQGANRDASAGQSHGAEGSASPTGRGANGASARGAAPVFHTPKPGSQQVLKAEAARPDATARDAPVHASPRVGAMGAGQAADAAPADGVDMDRLGRRNPLEAAAALLRGPGDDLIDAAFEVHEGKPRAPLTGANATVSLSGEIAIVAECGTVILFDKARAAQLLAFFAGRAA